MQGTATNDGPMFDFQQAEGECIKKGAHLISIHNKAEQDFLSGWWKEKNYEMIPIESSLLISYM